MEKEIEYLRFDCNCCGAAVQFAPVGIEHMIVKNELHARRLTRHNPGVTIYQGVLKDKSIIRQSLAARLQAFEGRSMKTPLRRWRHSPFTEEKKSVPCAYHFDRSKQPSPFVGAAKILLRGTFARKRLSMRDDMELAKKADTRLQ